MTTTGSSHGRGASSSGPVHRPRAGISANRRARRRRRLNRSVQALVGTDGTIDWYCPEALLTPQRYSLRSSTVTAAGFASRSACADAQPKQLYLPNTNVLITRFLTPDGVGEVHDFMPIDAGPQRLVRRVVAVRGAMRFRLELEPRFDYARDTHEVRLDPGQARFISDHATGLLGTGGAHAPAHTRRSLPGVRAAGGGESRLRVADRRQRRAAGRGARRRAGARHRGLLARMAGPINLQRPLARNGAPLGARAEAAQLPADRRDRGRADHKPARADRRPAQLGLSL